MTIRCNLAFLLCWRLRDRDERDQLFRSIPGKYGGKLADMIYEMCTSEKYSFLY